MSGPPSMREGQEYINQGQDDQMEITGYHRNTWKTVLVWFFIMITIGMLRLFFYWFPQLFIILTNSKCSLDKAEIVVLKDQYKQWFVSAVKVVSVEQNGGAVTPSDIAMMSREEKDLMGETSIKYFISKKLKYLWNEKLQGFEKAKGLQDTVSCSYFHGAKGLTSKEQTRRRQWFNENAIRVHVTPILKILFTQVISPFYIFQLFSCIMWFIEVYYYYAACIIVMSIISITATVYQTRKMQRALRNTISVATRVTVCRGLDEVEEINSEDLVPGDVIEIPIHGCIMQCDAVLTSGNCIVNESMLTGESVPITKTPIPNPKMSSSDDIGFSIKNHARHVLFCGTHVIQTRSIDDAKVRAVVVRTGFSTTKGELVRSILYPKPVDFRFNRDTYIFIGVLGAIAVIGFIYTLVIKIKDNETPKEIVIKALDIVTIAVPPALPAALTIGIVFAQGRLKEKSVYCISPNSINISGSINVFCFDKTGTLTEDGLSMHCVQSCADGRFTEETANPRTLPAGPVLTCMAVCHSLTTIDNEICGDPLDLIMFNATGWIFEERPRILPGSDIRCPAIVRPKLAAVTNPMLSGQVVGLMRQFTFESSLQRMSVLTRRSGAQHFELYAKGSPEMIARLSRPESVPPNFDEVLRQYAQHGYRVIALAWRRLPESFNSAKVDQLQREQVETELTFLGLLVMENRLKPETAPVITQLKQANIRTVMVTGDNILTAMSVARECGMLSDSEQIIRIQASPPDENKEHASVEYTTTDDVKSTKLISGGSLKNDKDVPAYHLAIDGSSWSVIRKYYPDILQKLVIRGTVFARMSPDQKSQLVESLQDIGYYVGMCGDGANDCGALKAAHAGISLSEAEASVASPFTSKKPDIECVPNLIGEGRAAIVASFGVFKLMACYSLTQFVSVCLMMWIECYMWDFEFLYIDLCLLTTLALTFGRTEPLATLHRDPPLIKLFSIGPILSILLQMSLVIATQTFFFLQVQQQSWFVPFSPISDRNFASYENMAVFLISCYQYVTQGVIFSKGRPYRKPFVTNRWFVGDMTFFLAITLWLTIQPTEGFAEFMQLKVAPVLSYRLMIIGVAFIYFLLSYFAETYIADNRWVNDRLQEILERRFVHKTENYQSIEADLKNDSSWPPLSKSSDAFTVISENQDIVLTKRNSKQTNSPGIRGSDISEHRDTRQNSYHEYDSNTEGNVAGHAETTHL